MKRLIAVIVILAVMVVVVVTSDREEENRQTIYVTNFSLYDAVRAIAPTAVKVKMLTPFGQDLHTFEPTPKNITSILGSKHFFYLGKGMDSWIADMDVMSGRKNITDLSSAVEWLASEGHHCEADHDHEKEDGREEMADPHYWLDMRNQIAVAEAITQKLLQLDTHEQEAIRARAKAYTEALAKLDAAFRQSMQQCSAKSIFVTHDAFAYMEGAYGIKTVSIVGMLPQSSPNPAKLSQVIGELKKNRIDTIFFESFISDKIATAIAKEAKIQTDMLHTLATISGDDAANGVTYRDLMQQNITKILKSLGCR